MQDCYVDFCIFESKENWLTMQKKLYPLSGFGRVRYGSKNVRFVNGISENAFYKLSDDYRYVSIIFFGEPVCIYRVRNIQRTPIRDIFMDKTPTRAALDKALFNLKYQKRIHDENTMLLKYAKDNKHIRSSRRWYDDLPGQCGYY